MFRPLLALDLGSESSRIVAARVSASPISMPTRVAIDLETDSIIAFGEEARRMVGRVPPRRRVEFPIQAGAITQPDLAELLIRKLIRQAIGRRSLNRPDLVLSAPAHTTSVQRHALVAAVLAAGARRVTLVHEGIAAALGAGLPVRSPRGSLIVEIGAEKTLVALVALGGIVASATVQIGGAQVSEAIAQTLRRNHQLLIGREMADAIKLEIGCAVAMQDIRSTRARGQNPLRRLPAALEVKADQLLEPIQEVLRGVVRAIREVLEQTPPELSADVSTSGIHLSGGGSLLTGLADFLEREIRLPVQIAAEPSFSVLRGCQRCAMDPGLLEEVADPR